MAFFEGTIQEFHKFIGPRIRNQINTKTKRIRDNRKGICEFCGNKSELDSAHIHGKDRRSIIEDVLASYNLDGLVKIELSEIENMIIDKHYPIEQTFKFLCKSCHRKYDEPHKQKKTKKNVLLVQSDTAFSKLDRIKLWAKKPTQNNSKIISAYLILSNKDSVKLDDLEKLCSDVSSQYYVKLFISNYRSMKTDTGNNHGHIFDDDGQYITMPIVVKEEVEKYWNP